VDLKWKSMGLSVAEVAAKDGGTGSAPRSESVAARSIRNPVLVQIFSIGSKYIHEGLGLARSNVQLGPRDSLK